MARDYLEDMLSKSENSANRRPASSFSIRTGERTIRNITAPNRRGLNSEQGRTRQPVGPASNSNMGKRGGQSTQTRIWIWIAAALALFVLSVIVLLSFRNTTVTVVPVSRAVTFDKTCSKVFSARPGCDEPTSK